MGIKSDQDKKAGAGINEMVMLELVMPKKRRIYLSTYKSKASLVSVSGF